MGFSPTRNPGHQLQSKSLDSNNWCKREVWPGSSGLTSPLLLGPSNFIVPFYFQVGESNEQLTFHRKKFMMSLVNDSLDFQP